MLEISLTALLFILLLLILPALVATQEPPTRPGTGIGLPRMVKRVNPELPEAARAAGVEGTVVIQVTIGEDGRVREATVLRSIPLLDEAALAAVRQWEYEPAVLNGKPVPLNMTVTVNFSLNGSAAAPPPPTRVPGAVGQPPTPFPQQSAVDRTTWRVPMPTGYETYELTVERVQTLPPWDPAISYEPPLSASKALSIAVDFFRQVYPAAKEFELHHLNLVKMRAWLYQIQVGSPAVGAGPASYVRVFILMDGSVLRPVRTDPLPGR